MPKGLIGYSGPCSEYAAESFFSLLKKEWVKRRTYPTLEAARAGAFDYVEMFYNPVRKHGSNGMLLTGRVRASFPSIEQKCLGNRGRTMRQSFTGGCLISMRGDLVF